MLFLQSHLSSNSVCTLMFETQSTDGIQSSPTPASLYTLSALVLHRGLVKLGDFYPHVCVCGCLCAKTICSLTMLLIYVCACVCGSCTCLQLSQSDAKLKELQQSSLEDAQTRAKKANIVSFAVCWSCSDSYFSPYKNFYMFYWSRLIIIILCWCENRDTLLCTSISQCLN